MNDPIVCALTLYVCGFATGFLVVKLYFDRELKEVTAQMCAINRTTEANMKAALLAAMTEMEENYRASLDTIAAAYEEELRKGGCSSPSGYDVDPYEVKTSTDIKSNV